VSFPSFALALGYLISMPSCDVPGESTACTLIGCDDGLTLRFAGNLDRSKPYRIAINTITATPEEVPVMTCELTPNGEAHLITCKSVTPHTEDFDSVTIKDNGLSKLHVVVTKAGAMISESTLQPLYSTKEINGEGCGKCTQASAQISIPE